MDVSKKLHTFHVDTLIITSSDLILNNKEKLPNLRCFSLYCDMDTEVYDESIVPLLHRMLNLEELDLHLGIIRDKEFLDGNELKKNIVDHMSRLNKFTFNIRSIILHHNEINLQTNENIQRTFEYFQDNKISACCDYLEERRYSQCHIYSHPYKLKFYNDITNNFPGGLFKYVSAISLYDEHPFEHEFFLLIEKSFPFMKELIVFNQKAQNDKRSMKSINANQDLSIIKYLHLIELHLHHVHDDYLEQFLVDTNMFLPNNVHLSVNYESLERVTHNFTRNSTRTNCAKLRSLCVFHIAQIPQCVNDYFPHTNIFSEE